jgi:hypothetical protein
MYVQQQQPAQEPKQVVYVQTMTPLSPPYSPAPLQQTGQSYFPASVQGQVVYQQQQWVGQPQVVQAPYTPAATPGTQYPPQAPVAYVTLQPQQLYQQQDVKGKAPEQNAMWYPAQA